MLRVLPRIVLNTHALHHLGGHHHGNWLQVDSNAGLRKLQMEDPDIHRSKQLLTGTNAQQGEGFSFGVHG